MIDKLLSRKVYFDTSVFIYSVEQYPDFQDITDAALTAANQQNLLAFSSELALSEALVLPIRLSNQVLREKFLKAIQTSAGLLVVPVNRQILIRAAELRAATASLKTPDAIHLATALETSCDVFLTNDSRIKSPDLEIVTLSSLIVSL